MLVRSLTVEGIETASLLVAKVQDLLQTTLRGNAQAEN
jgi:hypothetical protein